MRRFIVPFLVFLFLGFNKAHSHSPVCDALMSSSEVNALEDSTLDETDRLIAYLESLLEERVLRDDHLFHFISGFTQGRVVNPLEHQEGSAAEVQREGIQEFIDGGELNKGKLLEWARQSRMDRDRIQTVRGQAQDETQSHYQKIEFNPVQVGSFHMGDERSKKEVSLTYPIEVMSTPVTQAQWVELMRENPSAFTDGGDFISAHSRKRIWMQPDHPVENVSWWSVLIFANRLSEKHGFPPVYGLDHISWREHTRASDGSLEAKQRGKIQIYTNGRAHDAYEQDVYYQAEGYRLPTEAEQEYLLRGGGKERLYFFGNNGSDLQDYAWYKKNSDTKTQPVAELAPLILDSSKFYDLHGNVWEWGWDRFGPLRGGHNPSGPRGGASRVIRGGCYADQSIPLLSCFRKKSQANGQYIGIGFRLVRTINPRERGAR